MCSSKSITAGEDWKLADRLQDPDAANLKLRSLRLYSARRASTGSIRAARRAGSQQAACSTRLSTTAAIAHAAGSCLLPSMPAAAGVSRNPSAIPGAASHIPSFTTSRDTTVGAARFANCSTATGRLFG